MKWIIGNGCVNMSMSRLIDFQSQWMHWIVNTISTDDGQPRANRFIRKAAPDAGQSTIHSGNLCKRGSTKFFYNSLISSGENFKVGWSREERTCYHLQFSPFISTASNDPISIRRMKCLSIDTRGCPQGSCAWEKRVAVPRKPAVYSWNLGQLDILWCSTAGDPERF